MGINNPARNIEPKPAHLLLPTYTARGNRLNTAKICKNCPPQRIVFKTDKLDPSVFAYIKKSTKKTGRNANKKPVYKYSTIYKKKHWRSYNKKY